MNEQQVPLERAKKEVTRKQAHCHWVVKGFHRTLLVRVNLMKKTVE